MPRPVPYTKRRTGKRQKQDTQGREGKLGCALQHHVKFWRGGFATRGLSMGVVSPPMHTDACGHLRGQPEKGAPSSPQGTVSFSLTPPPPQSLQCSLLGCQRPGADPRGGGGDYNQS